MSLEKYNEIQKDWNDGERIVVNCLSCKSEIYSKYDGQFVNCKCFKNEVGNKGCYVDQTSCYCRIGGDNDYYNITYKVFEELSLKSRIEDLSGLYNMYNIFYNSKDSIFYKAKELKISMNYIKINIDALKKKC